MGVCEYGDFRTEGPNRKNAVEITGMEEDEVHGQFRIAASSSIAFSKYRERSKVDLTNRNAS